MKISVLLLATTVWVGNTFQTVSAYTINNNNNNNNNNLLPPSCSSSPSSTTSTTTLTFSSSRRGFIGLISGFVTSSSAINVANAFDGTGSSAYSGYNPATKAELKKTYKARIVADVHDFNVLGNAIFTKGETSGNAWTNFFIQFPRREPDEVGRTYAALADLRGLPINKKDFEGGDGMLLANTFTKAGKPPDNTPAVQSFKKLLRAFDPIEEAGKKGDLNKAKIEYEKVKPLLSAYLADVELPSDLNDPLYQ